MSTNEFLNVLFNEGEGICTTDTPKGTNVVVWPNSYVGKEFVCLNPLNAYQDNNPTQPYHAKNFPRRADCNVTAYRNFLIEMDEGTIDDQMDWISSINLPFSTATFSGNKSVHFVIALQDAVTAEHYAHISRTLLEYLKSIGIPVDLSTKNPSRLTRFAGVIRRDTNRIQLLKLNIGRVLNEKLKYWFEVRNLPWEPLPEKPKAPKDLEPEMQPLYSREMISLLEYGAPSGFRNNRAFWLCCELCRKHKLVLSESSLMEALFAFDLPHHEKRTIISSSRARMRQDGFGEEEV